MEFQIRDRLSFIRFLDMTNEEREAVDKGETPEAWEEKPAKQKLIREYEVTAA